MTATFDFDHAQAPKAVHSDFAVVETQPWGLTLKSSEIPVSVYVRKWGAKIIGITLCISAIVHWLFSDVAFNAEIVLLKLAITAVFLTCAVLAFHTAHLSTPTAFELDHQRRELRTVLENSSRSVLTRTPLDNIIDIFVAKAGEKYALAYVVKGAKTAEVLAEGPYADMEYLERFIARNLPS